MTAELGCRKLWAVARKLRVEYPGAIYHVMNRGDRREPIFLGDPDRVLFLEALGEACRKTGWQVHALCLMPLIRRRLKRLRLSSAPKLDWS